MSILGTSITYASRVTFGGTPVPIILRAFNTLVVRVPRGGRPA